MRQPAKHIGILLAISATIFFTSLGQARLWDRDEPRNAGCAVEMMERGDLVVPIFNDELRHQKPALLYWLMISAYKVFGVSEFSARFWSALLGIGTVLLTYGIGRRLFSASVALLAGIALCSSLMFCVAARAATPDSTLIFFCTLGLYFYITGTFASRKNSDSDARPVLRNEGHWFPQNSLYVVLMNVAFGLAVLTKGPIGVIVPTAIIGMFLLIQRLEPRSELALKGQGAFANCIVSILRVVNPIHFLKTCWYMRPLTAVAVILLVAAPWFVLVGIRTDGDFSRMFFLNENFARATSVMENHGGGWWYYPVAIALGFFPWSIFLGPVAVAADQQITGRNRNAGVLFLVCWVLVQIGLFSLAETKLPSYVTPCYPALAILTAYCLLHWLPSMGFAGRAWQYGAFSTYIIGGLVAVVGLGVAAGQFFPNLWWISLVGLLPLVGGVVSIWLLYQARPKLSLVGMGFSAVLFCLIFFGVGTVAVDSTRTTNLVLDKVRQAGSDQPVATFHCLESSWVFYSEKPIFELNRNPAAGGSEEMLERELFWKKKPEVSPEKFASSHPNAMFITTDEHLDALLKKLPADYSISEEVDFFLKRDRKLILVERKSDATAVTAESDDQKSLR